MRRPTLLLFATLLFGAGLAACGDNDLPDNPPPPVDAAVDAGPTELAPCLDRPTDLARPPTGPLSCDLLPPGFAPPR